MRQLVLNPVFADRVTYFRNRRPRTPEINKSFKVSGVISTQRNCFGAPERNNLEPFGPIDILSELEDLASILASDPEVIHRLSALASGSDDLREADTASPYTPIHSPTPEASP